MGIVPLPTFFQNQARCSTKRDQLFHILCPGMRSLDLVFSLISSIFGDVSLDRKVVDIILGFHRLFRDVPCQWELDFQQQDLPGFFQLCPTFPDA